MYGCFTEGKSMINKLYARALRIVYNDTVTSFEDLLIKDKSFTIHYQNI